jgi:hypothetical protein
MSNRNPHAAMPGAIRPWNAPTGVGSTVGKHLTYNSKPCQIPNGICAGSTCARTVSLLPGIQISIILCDVHTNLLRRRAEEIEANRPKPNAVVKRLHERIQALELEVEEARNHVCPTTSRRCLAVCPKHGHQCRDHEHSEKVDHRSWGGFGFCHWDNNGVSIMTGRGAAA